jgi:hypothetical protein
VNKGYRGFLTVLSVVVLVLGLAVASEVSAQVISGDLVGTVLDKTGAVVPNAAVEAVNTETGVKYSARGNDGGEYRINNLPVGTYNVSASSASFATTTVNGFKVELNKTSTLSITLEIKGAVTTVEVSGVAQALDTTTAQLSSTFEEKLTQDLPTATVGNGVLNLSLLSSGVASSGGVGAGSGPAIGGQRPRNNNFTIEGVDNNSKSVTGPLVYVPNDAVAEFSLLQNQFSPEFGHSSGGQFNTVVRSGTNSYHGLAYIYSQNRNFNAIDESLENQGVKKNPRFDSNRMGGTVGGPVFKNKLFFFGNFEYNPVGQASQSSSAICTPTAAGYTTLASIPGVNSTNLGILQKYASAAPTGGNCPNVNTTDLKGNNNVKGATLKPNQINSPVCPQFGCIFIENASNPYGSSGVDVGELVVQAPNFTNNWALVTSMDYDISSKDQLRGRYIYNRADGLDFAAALPVFFQSTPNHYHLFTLNEYHTFTPNLSNEFRLGFNRYFNQTPAGNFSFSGLDSFPNLVFGDLNLQLGPDGNAPQFGIQNLYQAADSITLTRGPHTFKFGVEGHKFISPQSFTQRARGDYDYGQLQYFLLDFQPDGLAERSLGNPVYYGDQSSLYWYANDTWRIRQNLSINLGVRYEYTTIPFGERLQRLNQTASVPGLIDFSEPRAPKNNWGPRIGVAYSPGTSGKTSIRAGFGTSYDVLYDNIGILSLPPQLSGTIDSSLLCTDANGNPTNTKGCPITNNYLKNGGILPSSGGIQTFSTLADQRAATANHVVVNQLDPKSLQWNLSVQRSFRKDYTLEVRYVGTRGIHLNTQERINRQAKTSPTLFLPTYTTNPGQAALDALPVNLSMITARPSFVPAYNAAGFGGQSLVQFTPNGSSTYHGLATQLTRRLSNGLTAVASYTYSHAIDNSTADFFTTVLTPRRTQDFQNLAADRSNSALDHRQRATLAVVYDLPYFKQGNWVKRNALGNWEIAPIYTYQTGEWATVLSARDVNLNGDSAGDRTILNPSGTPGTGTSTSTLFSTNTCASLTVDQQAACFSDHTVAYLANSSTAQYIRGGTGSRPNVGRNTLLTRPIDNLDATAIKRFSFSERYKVEFQAAAFNVLNHPQFVPGSLNDIRSVGYTASGVTNYLTPGNKAFNQPQLTFAGNARTLQLALKLFF